MERRSRWSRRATRCSSGAPRSPSGSLAEGLLDPNRSERPPVHVERIDDVLRVTLDRPEARNAIDSAMRDDLVEALRLAAADPLLAVEIRGNGPCFSAGGDVEEFGSVGDPATAHAVRLTRHPGWHSTPSPRAPPATSTVPAWGPVSRSRRSPGSSPPSRAPTFRLPEVSMGLVPGAGGTVSIPRRIGRQRAGMADAHRCHDRVRAPRGPGDWSTKWSVRRRQRLRALEHERPVADGQLSCARFGAEHLERVVVVHVALSEGDRSLRSGRLRRTATASLIPRASARLRTAGPPRPGRP